MYFAKNGDETAKELKQDKPKEDKPKEDTNMNIKQFAVPKPIIQLSKQEEVKGLKRQRKKLKTKKIIRKKWHKKLKPNEPRIELQENNKTAVKKKIIKKKPENGQGVIEQKLIQKKLADFIKLSKEEDIST